MRPIIAIVALSSLLGAAAADPLAGERWHHRIVLIFADTRDDPAAERQRARLAPAAEGLQKRDVRVMEIIGDSAPAGFDGAALRARFDRAGRAFSVVLVGKDGGAKLRRSEPVSAAELFATIDRMPMARAEATRRCGL